MSHPKDFFAKCVKPAYDEWRSDPLTEWKAKAAVANADILAERVFSFWHKRNTAMVGGAKSVKDYRTYLRENICNDFGLVLDIHDRYKHFELGRWSRQITHASQTGLNGAQIVVKLDNSSGRNLDQVMETLWQCGIKS